MYLGVFRWDLIFVEDLEHIIQNCDDDARLKTGISHVAALVRTHYGRSNGVSSKNKRIDGRIAYAQQIPKLAVLIRFTSEACSTRRRCSISARRVA
jgi:hypothetical protein